MHTYRHTESHHSLHLELLHLLGIIHIGMAAELGPKHGTKGNAFGTLLNIYVCVFVCVWMNDLRKRGHNN